MRQASSEEEWIEADEVQVSLAGDQTTIMRLTRADSREGWPCAANRRNGRDH